ncbi:MAG: HAMP domain-containing sensor histidine kinase [Cyanobacteria bacterium P01_H01_bin.162]
MVPYGQSGWPLRPFSRQLHRYWQRCKQYLSPPESDDYLLWRHKFLYQRLSFGLWIGLICFVISAGHGIQLYVLEIDQIRDDLERFYEEPWLAEPLRDITLIGFFVIVGLILGCLWLQRTRFGKHYPAVTFLVFACAVNGFVTQIISMFYGVPIKPDTIVFLAFAVLLPLRWRLHLLAQLLPIGFYIIVLPLLGITELGNVSIFGNIYSLGTFIELGWVCLICNVGVFVYERLRRSEFESRRELQIFLHAISHDLRNPVMGTTMVVKKLTDQAVDGQTVVRLPILERLLQGSDRQLQLINSLVEAYHADSQGMVLHRQPLAIHTIVEAVLTDVAPKLMQNQIDLQNTITSDLPLVSADSTHLWRVFSNLMENALKYNPPGIQIVLEAEVIQNMTCPASRLDSDFWLHRRGCRRSPLSQSGSRAQLSPVLLCRVRDTGIGIPPEQRSRLFELYARGKRARYMPGLGLGLYVCKQIITAHGGDIGIASPVEQGTVFWFTLPLAETKG